MKISIPDFSLVVLIGVSGSGKSSFARRYFKPTEIVSSDTCRAWISDDENNQRVSADAFALAHDLLAKRLKHGRLCVFDATSLKPATRRPLLDLARRYHCVPVAIVLDLSKEVCEARTLARTDRAFGLHVIHRQRSQLKQHLESLGQEGFRHVHVLTTPTEVADVALTRASMPSDRRYDCGPFDIIGDVHGCFDELCLLLERLDYQVDHQALASGGDAVFHPQGRRVIFLGDLVDRGPNSPAVLALAMRMVKYDKAHCVPGNHEVKLLRWLKGKNVKPRYGLAETIAQFSKCSDTFKAKVAHFIESLASHLVLDNGRLVVAHAGLRGDYHGRMSGEVRAFALYGETTGETDEYGLPVRYNWAADYRGRAYVVYGHTPVRETAWVNRTICLDTGCVFGGKLTALRYPERALVAVPASCTYYEPVKPLNEPGPEQSPMAEERSLALTAVQGEQCIETAGGESVTVTAHQNAAVLEHMTSETVDPRWLIYLPPLLAGPPLQASGSQPEHPAAAFAFYRSQGVEQVVCQAMPPGGVPLVAVLCRSASVARSRFGVRGNRSGVCYDGWGRPCFRNPAMEGQFIARLRNAITAADWWHQFDTDWFCLALTVQPWSEQLKSLSLAGFANQVTAGTAVLSAAADALQKATAAGVNVSGLWNAIAKREVCRKDYRQTLHTYVGAVERVNDLRITPTQILASAGCVHLHQGPIWHGNMLKNLVDAEPDWLQPMDQRQVNLTSPEAITKTVDWWQRITANGQPGMVVKPVRFVEHHQHGLIQRALQVRGASYLRLVFGAEYSELSNLAYLRKIDQCAINQSAQQTFALGLEGLKRFVNGRPLRDTHACVFASLAIRIDAGCGSL